jgi:hypothetical protein
MASVKIVTHGCHRRNADLFLKTVCVSLALFNESQSELKVSPFTYGPLYCSSVRTLLPRIKTYPSRYLKLNKKNSVVPGIRENLRKNFHSNRMKIWPLFPLAFRQVSNFFVAKIRNSANILFVFSISIERTCYKCSEAGHLHRECPSLKSLPCLHCFAMGHH